MKEKKVRQCTKCDKIITDPYEGVHIVCSDCSYFDLKALSILGKIETEILDFEEEQRRFQKSRKNSVYNKIIKKINKVIK